MRRALLASVAVVAALAFAGSATASTLLGLSRAERTAERHVERVADTFRLDDGTEVSDAYLEGCERVARRKVVCEATYELDNGSTCYDDVTVTRPRGSTRPRAASEGAKGNLTDCDDPEDVSAEEEPVADDEGDLGDDALEEEELGSEDGIPAGE